MRILLTAINAKYIHSNLAVYSLRACAGEYKESVYLAEYTINNQKDYILEELYKKKPDVLCFSCYIWNLSYVEEIAREFKKICLIVDTVIICAQLSKSILSFTDHDTIYIRMCVHKCHNFIRHLRSTNPYRHIRADFLTG